MIGLKDTVNCLICGRPTASHNGGDYDKSQCRESLEDLLDFLEGYRRAAGDEDDFALTVVVKGNQVVEIGERLKR